MSDGHKSGILGPVLGAAVLSLLVVVVRLYGEVNAWNPDYFSTKGGGGQSLLGITWLVPLFGFWFGRRLALADKRPKSTGATFAWCLAGVAIAGGSGFLAFGTELVAQKGDFRTQTLIAFPGAAFGGLALLRAWPAAWMALAGYGVLARIPVLVAQFAAEHYGWHTHFNNGGEGGPEDKETLLFVLTLAQSTLWPFGFTVLVGGLFAAIGQATVRKHH